MRETGSQIGVVGVGTPLDSSKVCSSMVYTIIFGNGHYVYWRRVVIFEKETEDSFLCVFVDELWVTVSFYCLRCFFCCSVVM